MDKKGIINRQHNRENIIKIYYLIREEFKNIFFFKFILIERIIIHHEIQKFPRNSIETRLCHCCQVSGRPRRYYHLFCWSRQCLRKSMHQGVLPRIQKASW